jgi:hypothetical protein
MNEKRAAEMFTPEELRAGLLSACAIAGKMVPAPPTLAELAEALEREAEHGSRDEDG